MQWTASSSLVDLLSSLAFEVDMKIEMFHVQCVVLKHVVVEMSSMMILNVMPGDGGGRADDLASDLSD